MEEKNTSRLKKRRGEQWKNATLASWEDEVGETHRETSSANGDGLPSLGWEQHEGRSAPVVLCVGQEGAPEQMPSMPIDQNGNCDTAES